MEQNEKKKMVKKVLNPGNEDLRFALVNKFKNVQPFSPEKKKMFEEGLESKLTVAGCEKF